jgi:hypothetical protein
MLKQLGSTISGILLGTTFTLSAHAIIVDAVTQNVLLETGDSYVYTHDVNDDGFDLGSAVGGTIEISIIDSVGGWDEFLPEVILITIDDFDFDTGGLSVSFSDQLFNNDLEVNALATINATGLLDVTITSLFGDFFVGHSVLTVVTSSVPEPSALGLLGLGLLALGAARRRNRSDPSHKNQLSSGQT